VGDPLNPQRATVCARRTASPSPAQGLTRTSETLRTRPELLLTPKQMEFEGFAPLQSNTTYCPNQFFDVVLPHFSRGVVRLVGYVIYRTFAWSDRDGRPMSEQHKVSYRELIEKAGISRGALKEAIGEAIRGNLLLCIQQGRPSQAGADAESSVFELKWQVADQEVRRLDRDTLSESQMTPFSLRFEQRGQAINQDMEIERDRFDSDISRLDLSQVEQIVDKGAQLSGDASNQSTS